MKAAPDLGLYDLIKYVFMYVKLMPEAKLNMHEDLNLDLITHIDVGFPSVCCKYHWLIKKLLWAYNRAIGEQS